MKLLNCPNCGSNLEIKDEDREFAFCEFCGAKVMLADKKITHHIVDEAKIKRVEADERIQMAEFAAKEKVKEDKHSFAMGIFLFIFGCIISIVGLLLYIFNVLDILFAGCFLFPSMAFILLGVSLMLGE